MKKQNPSKVNSKCQVQVPEVDIKNQSEGAWATNTVNPCQNDMD